MGVSMRLAGMQPPEGPPVWAALNFLPLGQPPPMSSMTVRKGVPMGISTRPVLVILPPRAKTLVPVDLGVPMAANLSAPWLRIQVILA